MEITGHSRESTFLNYVQEKRTPTAKKLSNVFKVIKETNGLQCLLFLYFKQG